MKQFFEEIRNKEQKLTPEQEVDLFHQIATGNTQARETIFYSNLRFCIHFARKYFAFGDIHEPDLIQVCSIGLYNSIDTFDPDRGVKFISYARWNIQKEVTEYLNFNVKTIRLPASLKDNIHYPSTFSYDSLLESDDGNDYSSTLFYKSTPEDINEEESNKSVSMILEGFKPYEITLIKERIFSDKTYVEIAQILKKKHKVTISRTKVKYIFDRLMKKLSNKYSKQEFINLFI